MSCRCVRALLDQVRLCRAEVWRRPVPALGWRLRLGHGGRMTVQPVAAIVLQAATPPTCPFAIKPLHRSRPELKALRALIQLGVPMGGSIPSR